MKKIKVLHACVVVVLLLSQHSQINAQSSPPTLPTGGKAMPDEWIDADTKHRIKKLSRIPGTSLSFYFHNNPFVGNEMIFYNSEFQTPGTATDMRRDSSMPGNRRNRQIWRMNLNTLATKAITNHGTAMGGEIVSEKTEKVFYQASDSIFSVDASGGNEKLVFVFPSDFKGSITTVNANGTLLGGAKSSDEEKNISRNNPEKKDFFNLIYEAKLPRTLFTIDIGTGKLNKIFTDSAWLNHVQFSPTEPNILMFCHEGPWHKVDRIWTIDVNTKKVTLIHKRSMPMEIAGHEWFGASGKRIWFDLQLPRGETFFLAGADIKTGQEVRYKLQRNEWSVHYNSSSDEKTFAGDGGHPGSVAKAPDGQWIYHFKPSGDSLKAEKLVSMKHHQYRLEPNVHFSPDDKWIIFRANFEGVENIYAVEINPSK